MAELLCKYKPDSARQWAPSLRGRGLFQCLSLGTRCCSQGAEAELKNASTSMRHSICKWEYAYSNEQTKATSSLQESSQNLDVPCSPRMFHQSTWGWWHTHTIQKGRPVGKGWSWPCIRSKTAGAKKMNETAAEEKLWSIPGS